MGVTGVFDNISIILLGTKYPGNVGSVARAMNNFGLSKIRLVMPQCAVDEESHRLARSGGHLLEKAVRHRSLRGAARGMRFLVGTSAKSGGNRRQAVPPRTLAPTILAHASGHRVGIVFGPEDTGLVDDDLLLCQGLLRIPTGSEARSINLAHAVTIVCYELFLASLGKEPARVPKVAPLEQVEAMYSQLEQALLDIGFLHPQNARHMMFALRRLFGRAGLEAADVGILRGVARQIAWFGHTLTRPGNPDK